MKYYKKLGVTTAYTTKGKIYPSDYTGGNLNSVHTLADFYPSAWQEVPAGDFYVQEGKMPESFAIKRVAGNPLWEKYIDWWQKQFNRRGYTGETDKYYGFKSKPFDIKNTFINKKLFENCIELTLEQWDKIVNKTMEEEFKLPENWYIDVTDDNVDMLNKWYKNAYFTLTNEYLVGMNKWNDGGTKKGHNFKGITKGKSYDFGTKITTEQFIKYVLKEEVMEENKEIIGWKLKDSCEQYTKAALNIINQSKFYIFAEGYNFSTNSTNASDLKKAGVLELWFEPVYSQKFKVGDWVTVEKYPGCWASLLNRNCPGNAKYPLIGQITKMQDDNSYTVIELCNYGFDLISLIQKNLIKLATPEEIKAAQTPQITINGYKGEFFDNYVKFGCQKFTPEFVIRLFELQNDFKIDLSSYTEEIKQIAEYYNKK